MGLALMSGGVAILIIMLLLGGVFFYKRMKGDTPAVSPEETDNDSELGNQDYLDPVSNNPLYGSITADLYTGVYLEAVAENPLYNSTTSSTSDTDDYLQPVMPNPLYRLFPSSPPRMSSIQPIYSETQENADYVDVELDGYGFTESDTNDSGIYDVAALEPTDYSPLTGPSIPDYELANPSIEIYAVVNKGDKQKPTISHTKQTIYQSPVTDESQKSDEEDATNYPYK